jgi:hypothetical protein
MTPLYCTIRQAIELTGTNKKRLNEWIKDGLPIYRPPGKTAQMHPKPGKWLIEPMISQ